ncbi:SMP-30/gluconolactonase/LRE family protein [Alkalihalobacillus pseudalcaliphilus]|uniref:SMP-30/gluconolactonase/LRE family protein n=1 Tax=Alkalihalobacillus pseudalcaliphilus TaxID=79884 RepID=UPI00064D89DB|nr:SMP-30/gluconolactonase/LRE family protein [Alkalihalobacillus pseudalcaliphilus]KMK75801.1 SMP-30/gluconolaconase/LRE domain protein [Alkalihalobacillus pseudalcaliphilus]
MKANAELVLDAKASLGEGPHWDEEMQMLFWIDINLKKVHTYYPQIDGAHAIQLEQLIGAIVPKNEKEAIVALEKGFHLLNLQTGDCRYVHDPESERLENRFNDGKCDAKGRFWAGTMRKDAAGKEAGSLYCLETTGQVEKKVSQVGLSNGIAWSLDNQKMYHIDTAQKQVQAFDFELETGELKNPEVIITFEQEQGAPDGMTIDEEGMLWIAHWGGAKVSRWNPHAGEKLQEVAIPALQVTSCTFGGSELNELYVTTARTGMNEKQLEQYPLAGGLFKVKLDVKGMPANRFKG